MYRVYVEIQSSFLNQLMNIGIYNIVSKNYLYFQNSPENLHCLSELSFLTKLDLRFFIVTYYILLIEIEIIKLFFFSPKIHNKVAKN